MNRSSRVISLKFRLAAGLLLFLAAVSPARGQHPAGELPMELRHRSDLSRPLDLLRLEPRWNLASPDLFSGWMDSGLYGFYGPQPQLMITGLELNASLFGWQNLNMLPVSLDALGRAESGFRPGVAHGSRIHSGYLNLVTVRPDSGWMAGADFYLGNESGDPGPWIYDSTRVTPNVDRWGPDGSLHLGWSNSRWRVLAMGSLREHQPTDVISMRRLNNQMYIPETDTFHPIKISTRSLLLQTNYSGGGWAAAVQGIAGYGEDFLFLQPFGREVPTGSSYRQVSAKLSYRTEGWRYRGGWRYHEQAAEYRDNIQEYDLGWSATTHEVSLAAIRQDDGNHFEPGLILNRTVNGSERLDAGSSPSTAVITLYVDGEFGLRHPSLRLYYHGGLDLGDGEKAPGLSMGTLLSPDKGFFKQLDARIFYEELLPQESNPFAWWHERGYRFPAGNPIAMQGRAVPLKNRLAGLSLSHSYRLSPRLSASLVHRYIRHHTLGVPWQQVETNDSYTVRPGRFSYTAEAGSRLLAMGTLSHKEKRWRQELVLVLQQTLSGSTRYREYWEQVPSFRMQYELHWRAAPNTRISLRTLVRGSSRWHEYRALEGTEYRSLIPFYPYQTGIFRTETSPWTSLGLSVRKWFWQRRLSLQLSLRNLLDQEVRMHTIGASRSTLLHIRASFNFR